MSYEQLPKEIWRSISLIDNGAYFVLVRCCKAFNLPIEYVKNHFTIVFICTSLNSGNLVTLRLPNGDLHGCYDKPAIVHSDGSRAWLQDNKFNRANDLPARIIAREDIHGSKLIDVLLQEEAPDIMRCFRSNQHFVYTNIFSRYDMQLSTYTEYQQYLDIANATVDAVTLYWYRQNVIHRDNDRPAIVRYDNTQEWYTDGARHRLDRPAVIWANGRREWWRSGMYLRMDVIHDDVLYE